MKYSAKELRARINLTQRETAEKLGVSPTTYNAWEQDFGNVKARNAVKMAELFGVKIDDIKIFNLQHENNSCEKKSG